jgi:pseudouridine kinase
LEALTGMKTDTLDAAKKAAAALCQRGIRRVVVSIGAQGALYATRETVQFFRSLPVKSANATGAGDAFMAGLVYSAINKLDDRSAMDCAMSMAELTLESADAIAQNLNENLLMNRLNAHKIEDRL